MTTKKIITIAVIASLVLIGGCNAWYWNTESGKRSWKSIKADNSGGLNRVVSVYSSTGELLKTYEGKIDIKDTEYGNKVLFDLNGKRVVLYNATVIIDEQEVAE